MAQLDNICIKNKCNSICNGATCPPCQKECAKYHNWLLTKKNEWNGQKEKYKEEYKNNKGKKHGRYEKTSKKPNEFIEEYAKECKVADLNNVFKKKDDQYKPYRGKCKKCIEELTKDVLDKIQNKGGTNSTTNKNIFLFCDGQCELNSKDLYKEHVEKDEDYTKIKDKSNCCGLNSQATKKKIQWRNSDDDEYKHLKKNSIQNDIVSPNIYIPPRKQKICFRGLDGKYDGTDNGVKDEENLLKHLIKLAAIEGHNLGEYYKEKKGKGQNDEKYKYEVSECSALKYSFLDLRDIIVGTDNLEPENNDTEKNLKTIFKKIYDDNGSKSASTERKKWWTQNQQCVWEAMKCGFTRGTQNGGAANSGQPLPNCGTDPPSDSDYPIGDDRTHGTSYQFLRWFAEWGEYVCIEHKKELNTLLKQCSGCENGGKCNNSNGCKKKECETSCEQYKKWIQKRRDEWTNLSKKYKGYDENETYGFSPSMYLILNNGDVCSGSVFSKIFNGKEHGDQEPLCSCKDTKIPDTETSYETDNPAPNNMKNIICKNNSFPFLCKKKNFQNSRWNSAKIKDKGNKNYGVYAPPRRQKLCLENIWHYSVDETSLENQLLQVARSEGKWLKQYYSEKAKSDTSPPEGLCKALERTYADYRDLILGKDMWNGPPEKELEKKLKNIFKNVQYLREFWWKDHKDDVWKALTCDINCNITAPIETTPQSLRWYEEWYEEFCEKRQQLLGKIITNCSSLTTHQKCDNNDECQKACNRYGDWLKPKGNEWREQKSKYEKDYKNAKEYYENEEFLTATNTHKTAIKYLENTCKNSSDCKCDNMKAEHMDKIVQKIDNEYREKYEPLCTRCRMKDIQDTIKHIKGTKNSSTQKKQPSNLTIEYICNKNNGTVDCTKVNNNDVIRIPIEPNDLDKNRNKEGGNVNCGGIPSNEAHITWKAGTHYSWVNNISPNLHISPRREKLCYNKLDNSTDINDLKERLLTAAANDAYNLGIKYPEYKNHYGVKPCKALQYSFKDYKHLIEGGELLENANQGTDLKIKNIVKTINNPSSTKGSTDNEKRKHWWKENEKCVWDVMVCGYNKGKEAVKNKSNGNIPELNSPEGGGNNNNECKMPNDTNNKDQFLSWLSEWYEDYCNIRNKVKSEVEQNCKVSEENYDCKKCNEACKTYKNYMQNKEKEWKAQEIYYNEQQKITNSKDKGYTENDAKDYLKTIFTSNCGNQSSIKPQSGGADVEDNIELLNKKENYDVQKCCTCEKYNDNSIYNNIVGQNNCKGLKSAADDTNPGSRIEWIHSDGGQQYKYLEKRGLTKHEHVPPRRQKICFEGIDKLDVDSDEKQLRHQFIKLFAGEGYNLSEYYKAKKGSSGNNKYSYDVSPCSAMKYSFYDLRDIVLGHDMLEPEKEDTEKKLKGIFKKLALNGSNDIEAKRKKFWEANKECFWEAMKCGYKHSDDKLPDGCDKIPDDKDYPIGKNREKGTNLQFLRWFTEWGEDFCKKQKKQLDILKEKCQNYTCVTTSSNNAVQKVKCEKACNEYQEFINQWKPQYLKQSEKYFSDRANAKYVSDPSVKGEIDSSPHAYKYLNTVLYKICQNGECNCMKDDSKDTSSNQRYRGTTAMNGGTGRNDGSIGNLKTEFHDTHMPASLDEIPNEVESKCKCASPSKPPPATPDSSIPRRQQRQDGKDSGNPPTVYPADGSSKSPSSSKKPDDKHSPRPGSQKEENTINTKDPEPDASLNCAEKAAFKVKIKAKKDIKDIESKLKGNESLLNNECKKVDVNSGANDFCEYNKRYSNSLKNRFYKCNNNDPERFKLGIDWECNNIKYGKQFICLPRRRKGMCLDKLEPINILDVNSSTELLKVVQNVARDEGNSIVNELLQAYPCKEYLICHIMKYSFADLADIIRGKDVLKPSGKYQRIEKKLQSIFKKIFQNLTDEKQQYESDYPYFYKLREHWWNANRKEIWKAMTCNAPKNAYIYKTTTTTDDDGKTRTSVMQPYCAHNEDAPYDYDYIPQILRWMTEWSENLCKALNEKKDVMKSYCDNCKVTNSKCNDNSEGTKCTECQKNCKSYSDFVNKWKQQFDKQKQLYKELYEKRETLSFNMDEGVKKIAQDVFKECSDPKSVAEYLDKASHCVHYRFNEKENNKEAYVFKKNPKEYEKQCSCKITNHPLNKCPLKNTNNEVCDTFQPNNRCMKKNFNNDLDNWNSHNVQDFNGKNRGVLIPPRRTHLCVSKITTNLTYIKNIDDFKNKIIESSFSEGYYLWNKFKSDKGRILQAMKYSFSDYGDIIKGTDMVDSSLLDQLRNTLDDLLKERASKGQSDNSTKWWNENKKHIWNAMLCGYQKDKNNNNGQLDPSWCTLPTEDETPQFLRWLEEWSHLFCYEKKKEAEEVVKKCLEKNKTVTATKIDEIKDNTCKDMLQRYKKWYIDRNTQWEGLKKAYKSLHPDNTVQSSQKQQRLTEKDAEAYVKSKCKECDCNYKDLQEEYKRITELNNEVSTLIHRAQIDSFDFTKKLFYNIFTIGGHGPDIAKAAFDTTKNIFSKGYEHATNAAQIAIPTGIGVVSILHEKIKDALNKNNTTNSHSKPPEPVTPGSPPGTQKDEPSVPINDILSSTLPVGISFALGSIVLLFYMKKKPKLGPTKLFRVIDIPQNDYSIPTEKASNRYIPYGKYKGKTYIYVEGEETDDYVRDISSSDITSSSESEYEEMDINDIYGYKSPKYKTLIEVVLKPSSKTTYDDTSMYQNDNSNQLTDEEWNQLKQDFIINMLQSDNMDISLENLNGNTTNTQPNIVDSSMEEKPFITSIQDRYLHGDSEIIYNIDWNVPENISANTTDEPKYFSNDQYTGIDLINDSLNRDKHIDIYDELLKRKENELFGTKHKKNATTNSVVMEANSDPISNQIDLFNKWLDRHRNMCETWNNKKDILNKLNDEWNNENKEHIFGIPSNDNANDINRINDENYNMINTNNHEGNDKTSIEQLGLTNISPNDLQTQNNGSETRNLRTNISMDIHFDENNNNNVLTTDVTHENDQLENFYNS